MFDIGTIPLKTVGVSAEQQFFICIYLIYKVKISEKTGKNHSKDLVN
jgi:hypothetical protein